MCKSDRKRRKQGRARGREWMRDEGRSQKVEGRWQEETNVGGWRKVEGKGCRMGGGQGLNTFSVAAPRCLLRLIH